MAAARSESIRLISSAAAVYSVAITTSATQRMSTCGSDEKEEQISQEEAMKGRADRFAPRFDGLRFIETLVTAHR